jgi:hypothetical protein
MTECKDIYWSDEEVLQASWQRSWIDRNEELGQAEQSPCHMDMLFFNRFIELKWILILSKPFKLSISQTFLAYFIVRHTLYSVTHFILYKSKVSQNVTFSNYEYLFLLYCLISQNSGCLLN